MNCRKSDLEQILDEITAIRNASFRANKEEANELHWKELKFLRMLYRLLMRKKNNE